MSKNKPYNEEKDEFGVIRRTFYETTDSDEFVWHRDHEDRVVIPLAENNWMLQFDNELPIKLNVNEEYFIPKNTFHRVIKGSGDLMVEIIETTFEPDEYEILGEGKKKSGGKKDACYYKVKSRYKVWPSAYASGALVKCRKVGAKNWGNKTKEDVDSVVNSELNEVSDNMYDLIRDKYPNKRVIMSHEPEIKFRDTPITDQGIRNKPRGLWYGFGASWLDWIKSEMPHWERDYMHVIEINPDKILTINSREELDLFTKKYTAGSGVIELIDWVRVANDYSGIEIPTYISSARMEVDWYYPWDVESGCIWNSDGIKSIKLINDENFDLNESELEVYEAKKKRKLTAKPSSEKNLGDWFARKGGKGKSKGWVDCNTCRKDKKTGRNKCKPCGRKEGEKRAKYPACRPTPSACKTKGKGKRWGKKSVNENVDKQTINRFLFDFGMFTTLNLAKVQDEAKDAKAKNKLAEMQRALNTFTSKYFDVTDPTKNTELYKPETLSKIIGKVGEYINYIKPRIEQFVKDSDTKKSWLAKIKDLSDTYLKITGKTNENRVYLIKNMLNENSEMLDVVEVFSIYNSDSVHTVEPDVKPAEVPTKPVEKPKTDSPYVPSIRPKTKPKAIK